jgi:hypothetical protein
MVRFHPRSQMCGAHCERRSAMARVRVGEVFSKKLFLTTNCMDNKKTDKELYRSVLFFFAKTTSWIVFPVLLCVLIWNYFGESLGSKVSFFVIIMFGFLITIYGIFKEIKLYKKNLEKNGDK